MEYIVTSEEMKTYDEYTSHDLHIPGAVLMERASLGVVDYIREYIGYDVADSDNYRIVCLCGYGNNGGDGLCVARILKEIDIDVVALLVGNPVKATPLNLLEQASFKAYGGDLCECTPENASKILDAYCGKKIIYVDALFGVGLSRPLREEYAELVEYVNDSGAHIVAVDIPSGIKADGGLVNGPAIKADVTITFGFTKLGHVLYPSASYCGQVILKEIGITNKSIAGNKPIYRRIGSIDELNLPKRSAGANKGTYKKLLIIAGNENIYGAAYLAASAAFACGIGMVTIFTHEKNRCVLQQTMPEAIYSFYDDSDDAESLKDKFDSAVNWADGILIGPGIGLEEYGRTMVDFVINRTDKPFVADADAIRIIADNREHKACMAQSESRKMILTPHLAEFAALADINIKQAADGIKDYPKQIADSLDAVINCKDATSVIASCNSENIMINTTGNDGMASGGSGDVLAGITVVFLLQMQDAYEAAYTASYIHGIAGDAASLKYGKRAMTAHHIVDELKNIWEQ